MSWGKKRIAGVDYDLTHLDGFDFQVTPLRALAPTYNVRVGFGAHTFARDLEPGDTPDYHVRDGGAIRCFCPVRYKCSLSLREIIESAATGRAFFGNKTEKYLLIDKVDGLNAPYVVAFKMERANRRGIHASMFIVSAHDRPNLQLNQPAIRLATLVDLTIQGKEIVRPKK